tara:strand:- start:160 stop:924 length:765 start_codon:yes stop_codon:yes gene_type:complete
MKLLILASGKGKRLKHLTRNKPKTFVKIGDIRIIDFLKFNFLKFKEVLITVGYKHNLISKDFRKQTIIRNSEFNETNMVHSLFLANRYINSDIIVSYSDIIYCPKIIDKMITTNKTHIPINRSWFKTWQMRMTIKKIYEDAETLKIKKKKVISIGQKIVSKLPKFQFMGLIRINLKDYKKMYKFYKSLKNRKIDMTNFLNLVIEKNVINLYFFKTSKFWFEIDNVRDAKVANSKKIQKIIKGLFKVYQNAKRPI